MVRTPRVFLVSVVALFVGAIGCSIWSPHFVEEQRFEKVLPISCIAVVPFHAGAWFSRERAASGTSASEAAARVTRFVSEALSKRDVKVVPPDEVETTFEEQGLAIPRAAPEAAALLASKDFDADAILLGEVRRYREREGSSYGSLGPASVEFQLTLYSAPAGTKLWTGHFDQTQDSLSSNLFVALRYPGGGSRWLTAAELAQWGATLAADAVPLGR